jgi:hypothetical protein
VDAATRKKCIPSGVIADVVTWMLHLVRGDRMRTPETNQFISEPVWPCKLFLI